jgi:hypothetical protein
MGTQAPEQENYPPPSKVRLLSLTGHGSKYRRCFLFDFFVLLVAVAPSIHAMIQPRTQVLTQLRNAPLLLPRLQVVKDKKAEREREKSMHVELRGAWSLKWTAIYLFSS